MTVKIAMIITNLEVGGAETMLLKLLQRIDRERFQIIVISLLTLGEIGSRISALGIPVFVLGLNRKIPNPLLGFKLSIILRQFKPDLVHTWMYHADLMGGLIARISGCSRVIWGIRHSDLSKAENTRLTLLVVKVCALLSRFIPTRILTCSWRAKSVHIAVGYCSHKFVVIPNGFELNRFIPDHLARQSVRFELGLRPTTPLIGLVGRYHSQKNHEGFLEAAFLVRKQIPDAHFLLAGIDIDYKNTVLESAILAHNLADCVHLLGRRDDVPRLMASLDVLASSSHGEAFPNVIGEAMACGVPCVVTDVGDSADIIGNAGRVVAPGDMKNLAEELISVLKLPPAEKFEMNHLARKRVSANYEIVSVVKQYEQFYEQTLNGNWKGSF